MSQKQKYYEDFRNYTKEATELVKGLGKGELYKLYEIVCNELQRGQSDTRQKELIAVQGVIEGIPGLDKPRLHQAKKGYRTSMAHEAKAKDGNTRPNRKKV